MSRLQKNVLNLEIQYSKSKKKIIDLSDWYYNIRKNKQKNNKNIKYIELYNK
jgi:hypothetical protein